MIIIIWIVAIGFAIYMMQRNLVRTEKNHERNRERFNRLLEQLKKPDSATKITPEKKEDKRE